MSDNSTISVQDIMMPIGSFPMVSEENLFHETLQEMMKWGLGIACIVNAENTLRAVLTDGDIRRMLLTVQKPTSALHVDKVMKFAMQNPITVVPSNSLVAVINLMEEKAIWDVPVVDNEGTLVGLVHLHPVVKALLDKY